MENFFLIPNTKISSEVKSSSLSARFCEKSRSTLVVRLCDFHFGVTRGEAVGGPHAKRGEVVSGVVGSLLVGESTMNLRCDVGDETGCCCYCY